MNRVTQAEFARLCGVNRSTVSRWLQNGRISADEHGRIDPVAAQRMREATESPEPHHQARKAQFEEEREASMVGRGEVDNSAAHSEAAGMGGAGAVASMERLGAALKFETLKLQRGKAELVAIEIDKAARTLVERAEVEFVLADVAETLRGLSDAFPSRHTPSVMAFVQGDANEVHRVLEEAMGQLLADMATVMRRRVDDLAQHAPGQ